MKFKHTAALALASFISLAAQPSLASDYWVKIEAEVTGPYTVDATLDSNIPGDIELSVNLLLRGQGPDDIAIGTGGTTVPFSGQAVTAEVDGEKNVSPFNSKLPSGEYDVVVTFYPRWDMNKAAAESLNIEKLEASAAVTLTGSGVDSAAAIKKQNDIMWVMLNIGGDHPWDREDLVNRFGEPEYIEHTTLNPRIMKNYYFESIDMTFIVNIDKERILTWRKGRVSK